MFSRIPDSRLVTKLIFRLLPIQILIAAVGSVNGIVSGLFASNFVGVDAMSAVGLYAPITQFLTAVNLVLVGGSQILCGQYMGRNHTERTKSIFSVDIGVAAAVALTVTLLLVIFTASGLTKAVTPNETVRGLFNKYILGQAIGILPLMLGQQLASFLSLENQARRTTVASVVFILVNVALNYLFVAVLKWGAFGLALASSLGLWVFFLIQAQYYFTDRAVLRFSFSRCNLKDAGDILRVGFPGALSQGYQTLRRIIVNAVILAFVGSLGISAFAASDSVLSIIWSIPIGMLAVSRMLMSISIGEEDRKTLADVMRTMMYRFVPIMFVVAVLLAAFSVPLTRLFYRDPSNPVYMMTVWGFRIIPFCMPLSVIYMHFVCYGQATNRDGLVHLLSALDGVICVAGFSALLVPFIGMNGVYISNILNGVVTTIVIIGYAYIKKKRFPKTMDELMAIPDGFGASDSERMDLSLGSMEEVINISRKIQEFCRENGLDERRAYLSGLAMEEMAGNVIEHGFTKDSKEHSVDVRVVLKNGDVILRIKDDCVPFDPAERQKTVAPDDVTKNIGIRMVTSIAESVSYQSILGLNVLTIRI